MKLTKKEAQSIVYNDNLDWDEVKNSRRIVGHRRWSVDYEAVFQNRLDQKFYKFEFSMAATEGQDESPFEWVSEYEPVEVKQVERLVMIWEKL